MDTRKYKVFNCNKEVDKYTATFQDYKHSKKEKTVIERVDVCMCTCLWMKASPILKKRRASTSFSISHGIQRLTAACSRGGPDSAPILLSMSMDPPQSPTVSAHFSSAGGRRDLRHADGRLHPRRWATRSPYPPHLLPVGWLSHHRIFQT
jgi:hypothetical protein